MNLDNMNEEQYNKLVEDISNKVVDKLMEVQKEYDKQFKKDLDKRYGYQVDFKPVSSEWVKFSMDNHGKDPFKDIKMEKEELEWEISVYEEELQKAVEEERYEDAEKISLDINNLKEKLSRL